MNFILLIIIIFNLQITLTMKFCYLVAAVAARHHHHHNSEFVSEEVQLEFTESGVRRIAEVAFQVNENTENIGARRLHTVMERLLETVSFSASEKSGSKFMIDDDYVNDHLEELLQDEDLSRYIL